MTEITSDLKPQEGNQRTTPNLHVSSVATEKSDLVEIAQRWREKIQAGEDVILISFPLARDAINDAIRHGKKEASIPLLPSVGNDQDARKFSQTLFRDKHPTKPLSVANRLFSRILGETGIEFKVNEQKINNLAVLRLLKEMREALPDFKISFFGKWSPESTNTVPSYFIKIEISETERDKVRNIANVQQLAAPARGEVLNARAKARVMLGLSSHASDKQVEVESNNLERVNKFRELLRDRHQKFIHDPLSAANGQLITRSNSQVCLDYKADEYERYRFNKIRLFCEILPLSTFTLSLAYFSAINKTSTGVFVGGLACALEGLVMFMLYTDGGFLSKRKLPMDPLNTIKSPSIKSLIKEIRELGYKPALEKENDLRMILVVNT